MKKAMCFIIALAMSCSIATSTFATVTSESDKRTAVDLLTNGETKVDKKNGVIDENGTVLNVSKENPEDYLFKSGDYTYSLLDTDSDGNYFILSADRYGKFSLTNTAKNNIFDPTPGETDSSYTGDSNLAVYLNTDFLNGTTTLGTMTANKSKTAIDPAVKDYIVTHDWYIEGNNQDADEEKHLTDITKTDYSVNCKIALLSWTEYIKYSDKIGYASTQYVENNLTVSSTSVLRTPNNSSTGLYQFYEKNGNISGSLNVTTINAPNLAYLRPCFYVRKEYFKKTHLTSYGSAVKRMLKEDLTEDELKAAGYNDSEITDIKEMSYKSGFVIADDMENGVDRWVKKAMTTDEVSAEAVAYPEGSTTNKAMAIGCNTYTYIKLYEDAESGILTVEADAEINGGNFGVGIIESGYSNMQGKLYPLFIGKEQTKISAIVNRKGNYDVSDSTTASHYIDYNNANINISNGTQVHLKLIIDAATGKCAVMVNGKLSDTIDIPYIGTSKDQKAIGAIAFMNRNTGATAYVDNAKISYDPKGSAISDISTGSNKTVVTLREDVTAENTPAASDVILKTHNGTALNVTSVEKMENGSLVVETQDTMTDGTVYYLSIPVLENEYPITQTPFTYTNGSFSANVEITAEKYLAGETAAATCTINTSEFSAKKVTLYLAAYKGDRMTEVIMKEINISESDFGEITDTAELQLTEEADCIRAFIWNENQIPYNTQAEKTKVN